MKGSYWGDKYQGHAVPGLEAFDQGEVLTVLEIIVSHPGSCTARPTHRYRLNAATMESAYECMRYLSCEISVALFVVLLSSSVMIIRIVATRMSLSVIHFGIPLSCSFFFRLRCGSSCVFHDVHERGDCPYLQRW